MASIKIVSRFDSDKVLFECEAPEGLESGLQTRHALEQAAAIRPRISLRDAYLSGADLSDAYLRGAYLRDAYLSGADLSDAYLRGAYLRGADLRGADLSDADLSDADLRGADLSGADLSDAYLRGAYLRGADLSGADLRDAYLSGADLSDAYLRGAYLRDADLRGADLRGADLSDADLRGADGKPLPRATPEQAIENLDKVREIVLDNESRLNMSHWHGDEAWRDKTCAEEVLCGTTHCMAGWLQVCTTEPALKDIGAQLAGTLAAPVAAKMFFKSDDEALKWLRDRKYVAEIAEDEERAKARAARRAAAGSSAA